MASISCRRFNTTLSSWTWAHSLILMANHFRENKSLPFWKDILCIISPYSLLFIHKLINRTWRKAKRISIASSYIDGRLLPHIHSSYMVLQTLWIELVNSSPYIWNCSSSLLFAKKYIFFVQSGCTSGWCVIITNTTTFEILYFLKTFFKNGKTQQIYPLYWGWWWWWIT